MIPDVADSLPSPDLWPDRVFTLPEVRYPLRLNVGEALLDANVEGADGYFTYQCRSDDMIVSGGYKIPGPQGRARAGAVQEPAPGPASRPGA